MDFSRLRIDISNPAPPVDADDPYACPECHGNGKVLVMRVRMVGPERFDNTPDERVCGRCKSLGLDPELLPEPPDDLV